jgi:tRNA nucleotidyltransferase/poly(A) polymerase
LIRGVGIPQERFTEDPLRIVRAGRIAGVYGFRVDSVTFEAMREEAEHLAKVSGERVRDELCKILLSTHAIESFDVLRKTWALGKLLPELVVRGHIDTLPGSGVSIYQHTMSCVIHCPVRLRVRLAALFHLAGVPAIGARGAKVPFDYRDDSAYAARERMKKWNMSNRQIEEVSTLIEHQLPPEAPGWTDAEIRRFITRVGPNLLDDFIALAEAQLLAEGRMDLDGTQILYLRIQEQLGVISAFRVRDLAVSGADVMQMLGLDPGPEVGRVLDHLFALVVDDPGLNTRERLIGIVRKGM